VDGIFPLAQTYSASLSIKEAPPFSVRLRQMPGEVLLLAMGTAGPGERTTQLILIRRSVLNTFLPWLGEPLTGDRTR
jgi:hypothetical protein